MLCVWSVSGQELASAPTGHTFEDVIGLKCHLRSQHGFPVCLQQLIQTGRCLDDDASVVGLVDLQLVLLSTLSPEQMPQAEREFLEHAVDTGHAEVARALLAAGVDKNLEDKYGASALMRASVKGHVEIVHVLLDAGADPNPNFQDIERWRFDADATTTALMVASSKGHVEIVRLLLEAGADSGVQDFCFETALTRASSEGHIEIVRLLLDAGAGTSFQNISGWTALMHASCKGHVEIVRLLLEAGADSNVQNGSGETALMRASSKGRVEVVRLLLDAGALSSLQQNRSGAEVARLLGDRPAEDRSLKPEEPVSRTTKRRKVGKHAASIQPG